MAPPPIPYPTDPFLFIMEMQMQSAFSRRGSSVISKYIGRADKWALPDLPPAFPYGCTDTLYRPGGFGSPQGADRFCRLPYSTKPWDPNDPCLIAAAKAHWDAIDKIGKYYQDAHMMSARRLHEQLLRIEEERLVCRAGCDPQWPTACANECNETAETKKRNWNKAYEDEKERLDREEKVVRENLSRAFWAAARECGYDDGSFGVEGTSNGRGWGGPVPILREEAQA